MRYWIWLALQSAISRKGALLIIVFSTAISVALLLAVLKIRDDTKTSFTNAISGVDLIVGSKGSPTELILYSVFHIGRPTSLISGKSIPEIQKINQVKWIVPIQLGDTYRSYPVVGTNSYFFDSIKAQNRSLTFTSGQAFSDQKDHELVLGANVAKQYKHRIADRITLSHGTGKGPAQDHADSPFVITGILAATGTPIDNSVFISIQSFNNLHDGSKNLQFAQLDSAQYTAFLIGLQQRSAVFSVRRQIDALKSFSLMAIMPGVALDELWQTMEIAENALILVSLGVVLTSIFGIISALMVSLEARGREIATLRAIGARPSQIFFFIIWETFMISLSGIVFGWVFLQITLLGFSEWFMKEWGILIQSGLPSQNDVLAILSILATALLCSTLPAIKAYRLALHEGLNPPSI